MLLRKERDVVSVSGLGLLAAVSLITTFLNGLGVFTFLSILNLLTILFLTFIVVASVTELLPNQKALAQKIWFLPVVMDVVYALLYVVTMPLLIGMPVLSVLVNFVFCIIHIVCLVFIALWAVNPDGKTAKVQPVASSDSNVAINTQEYGAGYCDMFMHVLLLLFVGGIWMYIWIYRTTKFLNCVEGEEYRNPTTKLLLCMFVPFYSIYWVYKSAQRIDRLAASKGISSELSTLCLILAIVIGIIPPILMQDKINTIVKSNVNA